MKNFYVDIVEAGHPVWAMQETKQLYGHIVKEYRDCVPEKRPADTFNRPSKYYEKLYAHTWDFRWQYAVMTSINDFIRAKSGREQQPTQDKWIAYLRKAVEVYDEYVKKPTDIHELWVFRPYENQIAFVADLMKNIESKTVNVANTPFDLFGLYKTNLLYNMIMVLCVRDRIGQITDHSLDNRWKWAVMKVILHDSESRNTPKFRLKALNDWFEYLNAAYRYANRVPDEFQKFSSYEREIAFVAKYMQGMSGQYNLKFEEVGKLINNLYDKTYHQFYEILLKERQKLIKDGRGNDEMIENYTLQYTWQYALMRTINIYSDVNGVENPDEIAYRVSIIQKAYLLEYPDAILTPPAKSGGPGPAGGKQGPTAPGKAAEPVVEAPPVVDESPIQENEGFQKFKPCKKEMIFVADLMKKIHSKAVHVDNTAFALFGLSRTNLLYNMITTFYEKEIGENPVGTNELYKHSLEYRWQWAVMKAINFAVQYVEGFDKWIEYLQASYKYVNYVRDEFHMFVGYENQVAFVAKFVKRMFSSNKKPKDNDPLLLLDSTRELYNWIKDNKKDLMVLKKIGAVTNYTLDYTWQYALMLAMISLKKIYGEARNNKFWTDYLEEAYKLSQTAVTPTAPVNAEPPAPASGNGGPNPPGNGGGEQSDSATSGNDGPQSARSLRTVKETGGADEARANRLRVPVKETDKKRDEILKKLREIGETGGGAENDAGQTTTSTPVTSEPSTPRSGAAGGGAGGKLVEEKTPRSKPYDKKTESGNEAPAAQVEVPKLTIPEREVSPPASDVSDEDVQSGEEQSDSEGGGQAIDTVPSTPADTFQPETTPPPDQKAGGGRPQSTPQQRTVKETEGAQEKRTDRFRGAVTGTGQKRDEKYNSVRNIPKQDGKGPPTGAEQADGGAASGDVEAVQGRGKEKASTQSETTTTTTPRTPRTPKESTLGKVQAKALQMRRDTLIAKSTSKIEQSQHESFSRKHHDSILELKKLYEERERQRKKEESKRKMNTQEFYNEDDEEKEKRQRTGQTLEEITRVLIFTEEEERDMLYTQNEKWRNYSAQITKLTQYIKKFADEPATIFTRKEYNTLLGDNPKTKLLIGYFKKYLKDNAVKEDEAMNVFHFTSIQDESIIVDAINFVISYQDNVDEWETFLGSTPEDLDTMDIKLAPGIGSTLHTFPADVSPLIYDLTRRLEALQAW